MKSARERMDLYAAYQEVGTYRAAAQIRGTTHKTVKRAVAKARAAEATPPGAEGVIAHNYDDVSAVIAKRVDRTEGRITAKRLLPVVRAAGYEGSARNLRRAVADAKAKWRVDHHRGRRPGVWVPGDMLVFDWGEIGPLFVFCAVLAWSRFRFVSFSDNLGADATMAALAQCMETIGGVPKTLLTDRMGCLKAGTVAGIVIPTPDYVRFVTHYGTRPDFCCGADPASKGIVENLVGYVKSDLMIPQELSVSELPRANTLGAAWCTEVNGVLHSDIAAVPAERLEIERPLLCDLPSLRARIGRVVLRKVDRLSCVRFGSAPLLGAHRPTSGAPSSCGWLTVWSWSSSWARSSPPTASSPLVRRPSAMTTTGDRDPPRPGRCGPRPQPRWPSALWARWPRRSSRGRPPGG